MAAELEKARGPSVACLCLEVSSQKVCPSCAGERQRSPSGPPAFPPPDGALVLLPLDVFFVMFFRCLCWGKGSPRFSCSPHNASWLVTKCNAMAVLSSHQQHHMGNALFCLFKINFINFK